MFKMAIFIVDKRSWLRLAVLVAIFACDAVQSSEVELEKYGEIDNTLEGFKKLCMLEREANLAKDHERYLEVKVIRMMRGAQLSIPWCPEEVYEKAGTKGAKMRSRFEEKCSKEAESKVFCDKAQNAVDEAMQINDADLPILEQMEHQLCKDHANMKLARMKLSARYELRFCDQDNVDRAKSRATEDVGRILVHMKKEIMEAKKSPIMYKLRQLFGHHGDAEQSK